MHHPWRRLRNSLPDWEVRFADLPLGQLGGTDTPTRTIYLTNGMPQCQRRAVLDHEIDHAEAGDVGAQHPQREAAIDIASARRLIPIERLVDAAKWSHDVVELAEECWVDVDTMQCRLDTLTDAERDAVRLAIAERDFHEEGMS